MHSDLTLDILDSLTTEIGEVLRQFSDLICPAYATRELPQEEESRKRRQARKSSTKQGGVKDPSQNEDGRVSIPKANSKGPHLKSYNMNTYKHHALGDYVAEIRERGTTDSYSTEPVG